MTSLGRDVRHAWRSLWRTPLFTVLATATLALGIGVNAAMFAAVSAAIFRPLPFPEPDRLVTATQTRREGGAVEPTRWSYPEFVALRGAVTAFAHVAAYTADDVNLAGTGGEPVRARAELVSAAYFPVLGVRAAAGRTFLPEEDAAPGTHPVALLGDALWRRRFGADSRVLGRTVVVNGTALTVVGVLPEGFGGLTGNAEIWVPQAMAPAVSYPGQLTTAQHFLSVVGRLKPGRSLAQAAREVDAAAAGAVGAVHQGAAGGGEGARWGASLLPLDRARRDPTSLRAQVILLGAVGLVLLLATVNVASLLVARAAGRARELAVRTALGASRRRVGRVLLAESVLLAAMGAALGVLCAAWGTDVIAALTPEAVAAAGGASRGAQLDSFATADVDWRVVAFAGALAVVAGLLAGLPPALRATRGDLTAVLNAGARGASVRVGSARRPTVLSALVMAEVAVAFVLLVGAGLLLKNFAQLRAVGPDVDAAGVLTFRVSAPEARYGGGRAAGPLLERVLERVAAVPGVTAATVGRCTPYAGGCSSTALYLAGRPVPPDGAEPIVGRHYVGPDHFRVLGIPVVRGRAFTPADRLGRPKVAVVNGAAARRFWPGEDPVGKRVWFGSGPGLDSPDSTAEVVGVVGDVPYGAPGEPAGADVYTPYLQFTWPETMVMVRTVTPGAPAAALVPALRRAVAAADPSLPVYDVRTVEERAGAALAAERFSATLLGAFGVLGLALAALGVYGVMAFAVAQRRREIGIRLALGATRAAAVRLVVGQGAALAGVGLAAGTAAAVALTRALATLLTGVSPTDPLVFAAVLAVLALVALAACLVPAGRAAAVPPATALASE